LTKPEAPVTLADVRLSGFLGAIAGALLISSNAQAQLSPTYATEQAAAGKAIYERQCASCHGPTLDDGEFGPVLRGGDFLVRWSGKTVEELFHYTSDTMPVTQPGSLSQEQYLNVI